MKKEKDARVYPCAEDNGQLVTEKPRLKIVRRVSRDVSGLQLPNFFRRFFAIPRRADASSEKRDSSRVLFPPAPRPTGLHRRLPMGRSSATVHRPDDLWLRGPLRAADYPATIIFTRSVSRLPRSPANRCPRAVDYLFEIPLNYQRIDRGHGRVTIITSSLIRDGD